MIDSANFISVRRDRLTLALFLQDKEAQTMFERKVEIVGEALGLLRKHAPETFGQFCHRGGKKICGSSPFTLLATVAVNE